MNLFRAASSGYRGLIVVALATLTLTACQQNTSAPNVEFDPGSVSSFQEAAGATAVASEDMVLAAPEQPVYYLYILDRDGVPVRRFECAGDTSSYNPAGRHCVHPDGTRTVVSEAVPAITTPERLPLKGEQP
ncbi:MAG TPA: hypothetical protein VGD58_05310 [Herpetosiphonaceae bacterium]